jgi:hypothetical protein
MTNKNQIPMTYEQYVEARTKEMTPEERQKLANMSQKPTLPKQRIPWLKVICWIILIGFIVGCISQGEAGLALLGIIVYLTCAIAIVLTVLAAVTSGSRTWFFFWW